MYLTLRNCKQH